MVEFSNVYASKKAFNERFGAAVNVLAVVFQSRNLGKPSPYSYHRGETRKIFITNSLHDSEIEIQLPQLKQTVNYNKLRLFTYFKLDWHLLNNFCMQEWWECSQNCWWAWVLKKRSCPKINMIFVSV